MKTNKDTINIETAEIKLLNAVSLLNVEDAVYELASERVNGIIQHIERKYNVVDADGLRCTSDTNREVMWYDEVRENAMAIVYSKIAALFGIV